MNANDYKAIEAAIAGATEQRRLVGGTLAAWEIAAMRKQLTQQMENANRRLARMRAVPVRLAAVSERLAELRRRLEVK